MTADREMPGTDVHALKRSGMIDMESNTTLVQRFPAHEAVPAGTDGPSPAVIVLHDRFGLTPRVRGLANRLAREGYYVLAPNLYAVPFSVAAGAPSWMSASLEAADRVDVPVFHASTSFGPAEREEAEAQASSLSAAKWQAVLRAAFDYFFVASDARPSAVGVLGFGLGARIAFESACLWPEKSRAVACVSPPELAARYPRRPGETMPLLEFENLRAPLLFLLGEQDPCVRDGERLAIESVLASAGKPYSVVALREAGADFFNEDSYDYRISAARLAWRKVLEFFREHLAAPNS
jgi:carboxymethylenebutenolidase